MPFLTVFKNLIRRNPTAPSLRERAAELSGSLAAGPSSPDPSLPPSRCPRWRCRCPNPRPGRTQTKPC